MRIIVLGTGNRNKVIEIMPHLRDVACVPIPVVLYSRSFDPEETGDTLCKNAKIKSDAAALLSDEWAMSDDSGLFVDALDGRPGVYSARYAGTGNFADNIAKVLSELKGVPESKRTASFQCIVALSIIRYGDLKLTKYYEGVVKGKIIEEARGAKGFGYDPIFVPDGYSTTFAEMYGEKKDAISHRGIAMAKFKTDLIELIKRDH